VLLIDSDKHDEGRVVKAITRVIPSCDTAHAKNCFNTSKQLGLAIITTCLKEHAEFYRNQLYAYGIKATIEPDMSTA
jgi:ATP-dependent Clp protease adaptor protein ClpS